MQDFFRLMVKSARYLGGIAFHRSIMQQIFLVFMMTISLSGAIEWKNEATISAICDNSTMHVHVKFTKAFQGTVYQSMAYFNPQCIYTVPLNTTVTEVDLSLPFGPCGIAVEEVYSRAMAYNEIVIQMHNLLDSVYDKTMQVSCEIDNYHVVNEAISPNPFDGHGLEHSWIEFKNGLFLFGEVGEPTESTLFFVVNILDRDLNQDMVVQNCIAHTDKNVTRSSTLLQLSNYYGCPDPSAVLPSFTVVSAGSNHASMFAYAPIANFSLLVSGGRMSVSCGVTLCEDSCPAHCNDTESPIKLPLSAFVTKEVIKRRGGSVMPSSLRDLNRHNDRNRRTVNRTKRSLGSFFGKIFHWESLTITRALTEGNITNITSTRKINGLVVNKSTLAKDTPVSANKPVDSTLNNTVSDLDEFHMDWQTFRFIALMTISLFVTILACYCCYADETKKSMKSQSTFIF